MGALTTSDTDCKATLGGRPPAGAEPADTTGAEPADKTGAKPSRRGAERVVVFDLGVAPYQPVQDLQRRLRTAVADDSIPAVLLLLEHHPVITLGNRPSPGDLLYPVLAEKRGVEVVRSERGGQATLHAPGQLVSYPIVPIPRRDLRSFVNGLEEILRMVLADLGVTVQRRTAHPGLYVAGDKIASIGLRCQRWVSSHGTSLNVDVDLSLFDLIVSCGEPLLRQTSIKVLTGTTPPMAEVKQRYLQAARSVFGWTLAPVRAISHDQVESFLGIPPQARDHGI